MAQHCPREFRVDGDPCGGNSAPSDIALEGAEILSTPAANDRNSPSSRLDARLERVSWAAIRVAVLCLPRLILAWRFAGRCPAINPYGCEIGQASIVQLCLTKLRRAWLKIAEIK